MYIGNSFKTKEMIIHTRFLNKESPRKILDNLKLEQINGAFPKGDISIYVNFEVLSKVRFENEKIETGVKETELLQEQLRRLIPERIQILKVFPIVCGDRLRKYIILQRNKETYEVVFYTFHYNLRESRWRCMGHFQLRYLNEWNLIKKIVDNLDEYLKFKVYLEQWR